MAKTLSKSDLAETIRLARVKRGLSWAKIAEIIGKDPAWTVAALLGQHPLSAGDARAVASLLGLDEEAVAVLQMMPHRGSDATIAKDPTIYGSTRRWRSTVRRSKNSSMKNSGTAS